jgi:hypothetical protein
MDEGITSGQKVGLIIDSRIMYRSYLDNAASEVGWRLKVNNQAVSNGQVSARQGREGLAARGAGSSKAASGAVVKARLTSRME